MATTSTTLCHSHGGATSSPFIFSDEEQIPSPPPPTPSNHSLSTDKADTFLSHLLTRLSLTPPNLTPLLPLRPKQKTLTPPVISLHSPKKQLLLSAATELGFFHLSDHDIPSHLHETFLQNYKSNMMVSDPSDLGFKESDDGEHVHVYETDGGDEYAGELKRVGLKVIELLFGERGFGPEARCLMCVSLNKTEENRPDKGKKEYPYIVGLTYEGRGREVPKGVVDETGEWVQVGALEDAVLVTIGELSQVI